MNSPVILASVVGGRGPARRFADPAARYSPVPPAPTGEPTCEVPVGARPGTPVVSEPKVFDDAPGIDYAWLHEDLHRLHLTDSAPWATRASLP
ncbi:hypothetical protein GCM10022233_87800 [Streptomyces shaanxiensis]|uniref:Uncharacterized protein n=1 Tax=Streptomyces shaanxiensis TaxID=653357 RepID=A0ABP7WKU8_9ACTN